MTIEEAISAPAMITCMATLIDRKSIPTPASKPGINVATCEAMPIQYSGDFIPIYAMARVNTDAPMRLLGIVPATWLRMEDGAGRQMDVWHSIAAVLRDHVATDRPNPAPLPGIDPAFWEAGSDPRLAGSVGRWFRKLHRNDSWAPMAKPLQMQTL